MIIDQLEHAVSRERLLGGVKEDIIQALGGRVTLTVAELSEEVNQIRGLSGRELVPQEVVIMASYRLDLDQSASPHFKLLDLVE